MLRASKRSVSRPFISSGYCGAKHSNSSHQGRTEFLLNLSRRDAAARRALLSRNWMCYHFARLTILTRRSTFVSIKINNSAATRLHRGVTR